MNPAQDYILSQPEPFRSILLHLEATVQGELKEAQLLYKYRVPFFYIDNKPFCYLIHTKGYIDVGFWNSAHMTVHSDKMITAKRKHMKSLRYKSLVEINQQVLIEVLQDAYANRHKGFYK